MIKNTQYFHIFKNSLKTHRSDAEQRIHKIPIIMVDEDVVRCLVIILFIGWQRYWGWASIGLY